MNFSFSVIKLNFFVAVKISEPIKLRLTILFPCDTYSAVYFCFIIQFAQRHILFREYSFFFQLNFADFANSAWHQINANKATSQAQLRGILFITFFEG